MGKKHSIDVVKPDISAQDFFVRYVSKRKPVIIDGLLDDPSFRAQKWTNLDYLKSKSGDVEVLVEPMHKDKHHYGTDTPRKPSSFGDFLDSLRNSDAQNHYLTTQYTEDEDEVITSFPPPTQALLDDVPVKPRLMGNLVLQQVNLWLGKSLEGSASGLHHDFHDNLYCLLRGRKRFVLFPPREVKHLYPYGALEKVHPNGLICYKDAIVRADGLSLRMAAKASVEVIERQIEAVQKEIGKGKQKEDNQTLEFLHAIHDDAVEELLRVSMDEQSDEGDEVVDDFDLLGDEFKDDDGLDGADEGDDDDEQLDVGDDDDDDEAEEEEEEEEDGPIFEYEARSNDKSISKSSHEPSSFSRIPPAYLHKHLGLSTTAKLPPDFSEDFPELSKATKPFVVELHRGQMLYLPASWWHEVTSSSDDASQDGDDNVHMAFNYWFYPPDALNRFEEPYADKPVWEYLREKARVIAEQVTEASSDLGKRKRDDEDLKTKRRKT